MGNCKWIFGVVGNITAKHIDEEGNIYYGTKAFTPGTKVYIGGKYWHPHETDSDPSTTTIHVIGRNRFGRIVAEYIPVFLIENIRTQRIYSPNILNIISNIHALDGEEWWGNTVADRKGAENFVNMFKTLFNQTLPI